MKKAFTLIEILVVMIIIGAMAAIGITAMTNFRRSIQLQEATSELLAIFKETDNLAKNNNFPQQIAAFINGNAVNLNYTYAYYLKFYETGGNYTVARGVARKENVVGSSWQMWDSSSNNFTSGGTDLSPDLKSAIISNIDFKTDFAGGCNAVIFINLTGDLKVMLYANTFPTGTVDESTICNINIKHNAETSVFKVLQVDPVNDTFKLNIGE